MSATAIWAALRQLEHSEAFHLPDLADAHYVQISNSTQLRRLRLTGAAYAEGD